MPSNRPTASVTGQGEWEWNRRGDAGDDRDAPTGSSTRPSREQGDLDRRPRCRERVAELEREIEQLESEVERREAELERKERRMQEVINHYERLLSERDHELAARAADSKSAGTLSSVLPDLFDR